MSKKTADILENGYQHYLGLGGIINEKDYQGAFDRMSNTHVLDRKNPHVRVLVVQVTAMARHAKITLSDSEDAPDPKIVLYVILRSDIMSEGVKYHHSQMSDQRIFGEVLRILGDVDSLDKLIEAYPNISFKYEKGE